MAFKNRAQSSEKLQNKELELAGNKWRKPVLRKEGNLTSITGQVSSTITSTTVQPTPVTAT